MDFLISKKERLAFLGNTIIEKFKPFLTINKLKRCLNLLLKRFLSIAFPYFLETEKPSFGKLFFLYFISKPLVARDLDFLKT